MSYKVLCDLPVAVFLASYPYTLLPTSLQPPAFIFGTYTFYLNQGFCTCCTSYFETSPSSLHVAPPFFITQILVEMYLI